MSYRPGILAALLFTAACTSKQPGPIPRYAVLRFENLTSDRSLDWIGRAASEVLAQEIGAVNCGTVRKLSATLGPRPLSAPGTSTELTGALLAGANRIIIGYVEKIDGNLVFTAIEENAQTGRRVRSAEAQGAVLDAANSLARQLSSKPERYATHNETALGHHVRGLESKDGGATEFEAAVTADPKFTEPYLAWNESALARGDVAAAQQILASAQTNGIGDSAIAKLQFEIASANQDAPARLTALKRMVEINPGDVAAQAALGNAELLAHHFANAAAAFAKGAASARPDLYNQRVYALMFGGDEKGAMSAVHEYQKALPQDANAIDTEGDVQFYYGHFREAEMTYLKVAAKDPHFNESGELWKAARARLMTGDTAGANQIFNTYKKQLEKLNDRGTGFRTATWQFLTGDQPGAVETLHQIAGNTDNKALKTLALAQAAIWELHMGRKRDALQDANTVLTSGQNPSALVAGLVRFAADGAGQSFTGTAGSQFRALAIGYALIFAKRYKEAVPVWKQIYEQSNPNDQTIAFVYALSLRKSGQMDRAQALMKSNPLPSANLVPSFECLYFPELFRPADSNAVSAK